MSKQKKSSHRGFNYREIQIENSRLRQQLTDENRSILKTEGYRNVGWIHVIALFDKICDMLEVQKLAGLGLESLFLEADRIGNKYQSSAEVQAFQAAMAIESEAIAEIIDHTWPDEEPESIDFSNSQTPKKWQRSVHRKTYQTMKG
jgi:hypothetical protein